MNNIQEKKEEYIMKHLQFNKNGTNHQPIKENLNTPKLTISKKNSSNSDKKTTITINNINTNISINTTINIPDNTDPNSIVINPEIKKFEVISKDSGKQDNFVKVIVNSNLNNQKPRGIS